MNHKSTAIETARELCMFFDVTMSNPQGDPDKDNKPRIDPETGHGYMTPAGFKRKLRDGLEIAGQSIYVTRGACFERTNKEVAESVGVALEPAGSSEDGDEEEEEGGKGRKRAQKSTTKNDLHFKRGDGTADKFYDAVCARYFDVRCFGQLFPQHPRSPRGPVQCGYARSVDPVLHVRAGITRVAVATIQEEDAQAKKTGANRMMGETHFIPYALFRCHIYVNPNDARKTGFSEADYDLLVQIMQTMFENDRSSVRAQLAVRALYEFRHHKPAQGAALIQGERLLESIRAVRKPSAIAGAPPRSFTDDYVIHVPEEHLGSSEYDFREIVSPEAKWSRPSAAAE